MGSDEIVRFTHASDLHLGRYQYTNPVRANDYFEAFQNLLSNSLDVDFVLLAGDVFNSIDLLPYYFSKAVYILKNFYKRTKSEVPIIAIEGNHDIRTFSRGNRISTNRSWLQALADLDLITLLHSPIDGCANVTSPIIIKDVKIYGNTYCGEKIDNNAEEIAKYISNKGFNVLINHFGIEGQMKGNPGQSKFNLDQKLKPCVQYLGLGHFHKQFVLDNYIYNPGCLTPACLADFQLPHGYFFVEITKHNEYEIHLSRKRLPERKILWRSMNLKSKNRSNSVFFRDLVEKLHKEHSIPIQTSMMTQFNSLKPILCLTIHSPSGKILSTTGKKELREYTEYLQNILTKKWTKGE